MAERRAWTAVHVVTVGLALAFGLVAGSFGPRSEVRALRAQVAELEARPCRTAVGPRIFSEVLRAPSTTRGPSEPAPDALPAPEGSGDAAPAEPMADAAAEEEVERMKSALDLRRVQATAALLEQVAADDEQMATVEQITADMNAQLRQLATEFVESAQSAGGGMPTRREAMLFAADALDILVGAEEAMWETVPPDRAEELDPDLLDPTAFIDGSIVDVMAELDRR